MFNDPTHQSPPRIERWILKLQLYKFTFEYKPGDNNPTDYLSHHPDKINEQSGREEKVADEYINYIFTNAVPKALTPEEVMVATKEDVTLQAVISALNTGKWYVREPTGDIDMDTFNALARIRTDLASANARNTLMRGTWIVIPQCLQRRVVNLAHEGHEGVIKTKKLLREKVWFPGIDKLVKECVANCIPCQASTHVKTREPLRMTNLPKGPWQNISVDFCGPFPSGDYLLFAIDDYSRYPEVEILKSVSSKSTIPKLDKMFSAFGIPEQVKSDNGPPFNSTEFRQFADYLGFSHRKITPYWPEANGEVETFMRTLEKAIRAAQVEGKPWKQELYTFLRNYRATPHSTTNVPPFDAMFQRSMRTKLPKELSNKETKESQKVYDFRVQDEKAKKEMKMYADQRRSSKPSKIEEGDDVLVQSQKREKLQTEGKLQKKGLMITAQRGSHQVTRNSSHFKKVNAGRKLECGQDKTNEYSDDELTRKDDELTRKDDISTSNNEIVNDEQVLRRSSRVRVPPKHLADYVWTLDL